MLRRRLRWLVLGLAVAAIAALLLGGGWLLATESGLRWALRLAADAPGVAIGARDASGTLGGGFSIGELTIEHERARIVAHDLRARVDLSMLPLFRLRVPELTAADVTVTVKPRRRPPDHEPVHFLPGSLSIAVDELKVGTIGIRAGDSGVDIARIAASVVVSRSRIDASHFSASVNGIDVGGEAALQAGDPLGLDSTLRATLRSGSRTASVAATTTGPLTALRLTLQSVSPAGAAFSGVLDLNDQPKIDGRLTLHHWDPASAGWPSPAGALDGALDLAGWLDGLRINGNVRAAHLATGPVSLSAVLAESAGELTIRESTATIGASNKGSPARLSLHGRVSLRHPGQLDLHAGWSDLRWPLTGLAPRILSRQGALHLSGQGRYDYELSADLAGQNLPGTALGARGTVDSARLAITAFDARIAGGHLSGSGLAAFDGGQPWSLAVHGDGIDPAAWRPALGGRVGFDLRADGAGITPPQRWSAQLARFDGTVRHQPAHGTGTVSARDGELRFDDIRIAFGSAQLTASGALGAARTLDWHLVVRRLDDFVAGAGGALKSDGVISGDLEHLLARGTLSGTRLAWGDWHADQLSTDVAVDASDRTPSSAKVLVRGASHAARRLDELNVTMDGVASDHALTLRWTQGGDHGALAMHGALRAGIWTVDFKALDVSGPPLVAYHLETPGTLILSPADASLSHLCLANDAARICAEGNWSRSRPWQANLDARGLPLRIPGLTLPRDTDYSGTLAVQAHVRGRADDPWTGELAVQLADGALSFRGTNGRLVSVPVGNGQLDVRALPLAYTASVGFASAAGSYVAGSAQLARSAGPIAAGAVSGEGSFASTELGLLPLFLPGVDRMAGRIDGQVSLGGTGAGVLVRGSARYTDGEIDSYRTNLLLRAVQATASIDGDTLTLAASANTRGGSATAGGQLTWRNRQPAGHLEFKGDHLLLADLPEARIVASPNLTLTIDAGRINVRGDITVPSARIAPRDLRRAVLASSDERIVGIDAAAPDQRLRTDTAVHLLLGDDVSIDGYGLKGKLGGDLLLTARNNEVASGTGELTIREGKYTAYTRELDIDRGRLLFAGQALGNPGLDIRAQRKLPTITAGINVRGTLLQPQISFYSDPALSQSQIAAVLIVGKTLDDIQDSDKSSIGGADTRNALIAQGSALLAGELGRYVGISDVGVESGTNNTTSVVVGKFLSPRLYVSYGVSLTEAINTLKLRYTIGDRWVIRTESGATQSADIEYTIER